MALTMGGHGCMTLFDPHGKRLFSIDRGSRTAFGDAKIYGYSMDGSQPIQIGGVNIQRGQGRPVYKMYTGQGAQSKEQAPFCQVQGKKRFRPVLNASKQKVASIQAVSNLYVEILLTLQLVSGSYSQLWRWACSI